MKNIFKKYREGKIDKEIFFYCLGLFNRDQSFDVYTFNFRFTRRGESRSIFIYRNDIKVVVHAYLKVIQCLKEHLVKTKYQ